MTEIIFTCNIIVDLITTLGRFSPCVRFYRVGLPSILLSLYILLFTDFSGIWELVLIPLLVTSSSFYVLPIIPRAMLLIAYRHNQGSRDKLHVRE